MFGIHRVAVFSLTAILALALAPAVSQAPTTVQYRSGSGC